MREYFPVLYGNAKAKERLGRAIEAKTLAHALLIVGPEGSGKRTLAREISAALNCENKDGGTHTLPCGNCNTCKRIREGNFTDVTYLRRSRDKATLGVEEVRDIREDMFLSSTESVYKIYVIEEADRLTPNAQNALLKVLEEPPANVVILLLAATADKILTTIKSRAQSVLMEHFSPDGIKEYVLRESDKARLISKTNPDAFSGIIMSADGRIGRALSRLSEKEAEESAEDRRLVESVVLAMRPSVPYSELYRSLSSLPSSRVEFVEALEMLIVALRDLVLTKEAKEPSLIFYTSHAEAQKICDSMSIKRLITLYDLTRGALEDATKNVSVGAIISDLGVKIKQI